MKIKVTVTRMEARQHTFEYEVEKTCVAIAQATAIEQAQKDAHDFDFKDGSYAGCDYLVEHVEVEE